MEETERFIEPKETNVAAENYLSKSQSYVKCGESDKMLEVPESEPITINITENQTQGYETPVKVKCNGHLKTPTNECPQYYTDMASGRSTS